MHAARDRDLMGMGMVPPHSAAHSPSASGGRPRMGTRIRVDSFALAMADEDAIVSSHRLTCGTLTSCKAPLTKSKPKA